MNGQVPQSSWLPLTVVSVYSEYVNYVTYPVDFTPTEEDPLEAHIAGYVFNVMLEFRVDDDTFFDDPRMCIYVRKPGGPVQRIAVDTTMIWSKCDNCLGVSFDITVQGPGWLGCNCFPADYEMYQPSLEQLNRSNVQREVYLRLPD